MTEWRPIETAPKDGTEFDGWGYVIPDSAEMPSDPKSQRHTECYWGRRDSDYVKRSKRPSMGLEGWCSEGHDSWSWAMVLTHWIQGEVYRRAMRFLGDQTIGVGFPLNLGIESAESSR